MNETLSEHILSSCLLSDQEIYLRISDFLLASYPCNCTLHSVGVGPTRTNERENSDEYRTRHPAKRHRQRDNRYAHGPICRGRCYDPVGAPHGKAELHKRLDPLAHPITQDAPRTIERTIVQLLRLTTKQKGTKMNIGLDIGSDAIMYIGLTIALVIGFRTLGQFKR